MPSPLWGLGPGDAASQDVEVVSGAALVDQSAVTGDSAPVLREARPGHQSLLAGSVVLSGALTVRPLPAPLLPAARAPRAPRWWPAAALVLAVGCTLLSAPWPALARAAAVATLLPPYLLLLGAGVGRSLQDAFWRGQRVLPLLPAALVRAAHADTLVLPSAAVGDDGSLAAVEFWPVQGVTRREIVTAAHAATVGEEQGAVHSVVILAKRTPGALGQDPPREPVCGPVGEVASSVARQGGAWPEEARRLEGEIAARGGECLGVADGARPLGLVELRRAQRPVTLDQLVLAGIAFVNVHEVAAVAGAVAELRGSGRRVAVALEGGMEAQPPLGAHFVLAGPGWAAGRPTALDLDAHPGKLPAVLLGARRLQRRLVSLRLAGAIADLARAAAAAVLCAAGTRTPEALLLQFAACAAVGIALAAGRAPRPAAGWSWGVAP